MPKIAAFACLVSLWAAAVPAAAQPALDGYLVAKAACPATPAIRRDDNPGNVRLEIDRAYPLVAGNRVPPTHYRIRVPGASPERRWVDAGCGLRVASAGEAPIGEAPGGEAPGGTASGPAARPDGTERSFGDIAASTRNLLAISWQPAFCETRPEKDECVRQTGDRFDASNFSLHGLWPQPNGTFYCGGVSPEERRLDASSETWERLPEPALSAATRTALVRMMPGARSGLDRHEWIKHGTCYGGDAEEYFAESIMLMDAVNASPVRALFAARLGRAVTLAEIRAAFDAGFGRGAGERVRVSCPRDGKRRLIGELTIGLAGEITSDSDVGALMLAASPTDGGCDEGIVDQAGLQ